MSGQLVLVTGITGFLAGTVANELLDRGYKVRGTCRGAKAAKMTETVKVAGLEFTQIEDVASGDFTEALKGVYAVIHVAAAMPGRANVESTLNTTVQGTLNVVKQAAAAGISKVVMTSTFGVVLDPSLRPGFGGAEFNDSQWGETSKEQIMAKADDPFYVYFAAKLLAEHALWDWLKDHPEMDVATILPGYIYGPFPKHFPYPRSTSLGTNGSVWALMNGKANKQPPPWFTDVRDTAKAHVLALSVPPAQKLEEKRFLICSGNYTWKEAAAYLNRTHPEFKTARQEDFEPMPGPPGRLNTSRAQKVLGMRFTPPEKTVEDAVASLVEASKTWAQ